MADPGFYDMNVHCVHESGNTLEEIVAVARRLGYNGIAITNPDTVKQVVPSAILDGFEVISGVEIRTDNASKLHGIVSKYRDRVDILVVSGGSESINRAAVENPGVDLLVNLNIAQDNGFNQVLAKAAGENRVAICFDIGDLIHLRGGSRVQALINYRKNLQLIRKYDVPFILSSNARSCFDMRAPREMAALAALFGMSAKESMAGLTTIPHSIIARNRPPVGYISEGVQLVYKDADSGSIGEGDC
ncbi:MAG: RNase P subunit p30 family protein [Methanolobus sp.]|uniref:ribonuclease P protein component 3 n=1 Tax=Methanolobus sp. TaxID=1874737 RepID=UPI00272F8D91|nr:RNase P subunit p30 family protein [Methanolobus sp.]MDP2218460.1 RNase P subunit p30 family protein [Methanolobus sp.]